VQVQFQLLYYVLLNKITHLCRTLSPHILSRAFIPNIESVIKSLFCSIFDLDNIAPHQWRQACLLISKGGFGLGFLKDIAYCAYPASFVAAYSQRNVFFTKN